MRLIAFLLVLVLAAPALAEKRVALVIGNSAYKHAPALVNPKNDAEGVAAALRRLKFDVSLGVDLDKAGMQATLRAFARKIEGAAVALLFYAGHGLQVNGQNYIVPVDAKLEQMSDLRWDAVTLADLLQDMEQAARTKIVILDACRDNPLARSLARSLGARSSAIGRGLAPVQIGGGTMIVFATAPEMVALDGEGAKNSPFTTALLAHIETPGLELSQVVRRVRADVLRATNNKQMPWDSSSLIGDFFFTAAPAPGATAPAPAPQPPAATPDNETVFWQSIKDSRNVADFNAYLRRWPHGVFSSLARTRVEELEKAARRADVEARKGTSTFEKSTLFEGDEFSKEWKVNCSERCEAERECVAWTEYRGSWCYLLRSVKGRQSLEEWNAGEIRARRPR